MFPPLNELISDTVESIVKEFKQSNKKFYKELWARVVGVRIDTWGDIKEVDDKLIQRVLKRIPKETLEDFEQRIADEVIKQCNKSMVQHIRRTANKIIHKAADQAVDEYYDQIRKKLLPELNNLLDKELKKQIPDWLIADKIQKSNNVTKS